MAVTRLARCADGGQDSRKRGQTPISARCLASLFVLALCGVVAAEPAATLLRDANTAAAAGDWERVAAIVEPLVRVDLTDVDRAEAHRLAGIAAYFQERRAEADAHFFAYLKLDLEARLDPALYPPDAVAFFEEVRIRHAGELRALRPRSRRWLALNLLPPLGQFQNGERRKGWVIAGMLTGLVAGNVTTYVLLRSWCSRVMGQTGPSVTCEVSDQTALQVRALNIVSGVGAIATYVYGVYDGVRGYRRGHERMQPFVATLHDTTLFGLAGRF
jgi:hypothetical protein